MECSKSLKLLKKVMETKFTRELWTIEGAKVTPFSIHLSLTQKLDSVQWPILSQAECLELELLRIGRPPPWTPLRFTICPHRRNGLKPVVISMQKSFSQGHSTGEWIKEIHSPRSIHYTCTSPKLAKYLQSRTSSTSKTNLTIQADHLFTNQGPTITNSTKSRHIMKKCIN